SVESTLLADAVQRRPDSKPAPDFERPAKARTVLTRVREKLVRKPKTSKPKASTADQQVPQEAAASAEIDKKPTEAAGEKSASTVRRTLDAGSTMPSSMSGSPAGEQDISSDKVDGAQSGLLSQPMMEHRADRQEPLRRSSKDTGADENAPGGKQSARVERSEAPPRSLGEVFHKSEDATPTAQDRRPGDGGRSLISQAARGIMLGAQRLVFRSAPSTSAETPALAGGQAKASPPKKRATPPDASQRETDAPRETMPASVLQRAEGTAPTRKGIVHRRQADNAPTDGVVDRAIAARSQTRPIGSTGADALSSATGAISSFQALKSIVSRKAAIEPGSSVSAEEPADPRAPTSAKERSNVRSARELLHRKTADSPAESVSQGEALGQATLSSRLVRSSERGDVKSEDGADVLRSDGDGKSGQPTARPRNSLNHTPQAQRRTQPASTNAPLQRATADTTTLMSKIGRSPNGSGPDETLTESETGRNEAAAKGLGRKLGAMVHKRESHGLVREDAPHVGPARPSKASRAADTNAPAVQRTSTAKAPASFQGRAVHRTPMVGVSATTQNGAISRVVEQPDQTTAAELDETEEPLYKKFTPKDIEFLSSKMFTYIKRRLSDDRERHGRPGFSMWS
ncbi:MAG: hypothetical protein IIB14_03910, partial [Chloroflexi bacterium]|nr:hypothetical protein [Chloroflexota bacterium]